MKLQFANFISIWVFGLLLAGGLGCDSRDIYIGTYQADESGGVLKSDTSIKLMEHGNGLWTSGDEEVPFFWQIKKNDITITTKDGGVITGHLKDKNITINLPGDVKLTFEKLL